MRCCFNSTMVDAKVQRLDSSSLGTVPATGAEHAGQRDDPERHDASLGRHRRHRAQLRRRIRRCLSAHPLIRTPFRASRRCHQSAARGAVAPQEAKGKTKAETANGRVTIKSTSGPQRSQEQAREIKKSVRQSAVRLPRGRPATIISFLAIRGRGGRPLTLARTPSLPSPTSTPQDQVSWKGSLPNIFGPSCSDAQRRAASVHWPAPQRPERLPPPA